MACRFPQRIAAAQQAMTEQGLDLLVVVNRENLIYFTGLTQVECLAVLIPREGEACAVTLWLDSAYVEQHSGIRTFGYPFPQGSLVSTMTEKIRDYGFGEPKIGFERYFVDFAVYDGLRRAFPEKNFVGAGDLFYRLRAVKEPEEIACIRKAAQAACQGMAAAVRAVRPGVTELDVLAEAEYAMHKAGSSGSPFRPQVVAGKRALLTHPCASPAKISAGEAVVIHLGAAVEGYTAKLCRTVAVGEIPGAQQEVYRLLLAAQQAGVAAIRPGVSADAVDRAARNVIAAAGWETMFLDVIGYGVGIRQSEFYPVIGKGKPDILAAGMVVDLLLPTIYRPDAGGPRVTDVVCVTPEGAAYLTDYPREMIRV